MKSSCPINASLIVVGDRWSLLVVRDLLFAGYRTFNQFLRSGQGIATNILADRIKGLLEAGIMVKEADPDDGRKWIYSLTPKGVDLAPVLLELSKWGSSYENGVAPPGVLERWHADRAGFLSDLRKRASATTRSQRVTPGARPPGSKQSSPRRQSTTSRAKQQKLLVQGTSKPTGPRRGKP
jgi:DNA-binding HxlR family transcriptional regulator